VLDPVVDGDLQHEGGAAEERGLDDRGVVPAVLAERARVGRGAA
jgi:hypothetical protein